MMKSVSERISKFGKRRVNSWVAGGTNGVDVVSTSQIYDAGTRELVPWPKPTLPLDGSCLAKA